MKLLLLILAQLTVSLVFSQVNGVVIDKATQLPVPYANVGIVGKRFGTTSDTKGSFTISEPVDSSSIVVSAIGYEPALAKANTENITIELIPKQYQIKEVVVKPRKSSRELIVDKLPKDASNSFASNGYSWINAKHFEYKPEFTQTPFVKQIRILTRSNIRSAKFNVRLLSTNENGDPDQDILSENLIAKAKKGSRVVTIDLSNHNIQIPQNGFFVALEWLIIEDNKHEYTYTPPGQKKKRTGTTYEPKFVVTTKQGPTNSWGYHGGSWYKRDFTGLLGRNGYLDLAIELTLTD